MSGFSVTNPHEISMIALLAHCLLSQGFEPSRITVLTTYRGQLMVLRRVLQGIAREFSARWGVKQEPIEALTVDMYQGDENDVILLSLVRSNEEGKIGFLSRPNRYCVALSRARHGLYVCGNLTMLAANNSYWGGLVQELGDVITPDLELRCPQHPNNTVLLHANQKLATYGEMMPWNGQGSFQEHTQSQCDTSIFSIQAENAARVASLESTPRARKLDAKSTAQLVSDVTRQSIEQQTEVEEEFSLDANDE